MCTVPLTDLCLDLAAGRYGGGVKGQLLHWPGSAATLTFNKGNSAYAQSLAFWQNLKRLKLLHQLFVCRINFRSLCLLFFLFHFVFYHLLQWQSCDAKSFSSCNNNNAESFDSSPQPTLGSRWRLSQIQPPGRGATPCLPACLCCYCLEKKMLITSA